MCLKGNGDKNRFFLSSPTAIRLGDYRGTFLVACKQLYKPLPWLVGWSVGLSVCPSVGLLVGPLVGQFVGRLVRHAFFWAENAQTMNNEPTLEP